MIRKLAFAAVGTSAFLMAGAAFAASPPEPYSAPNPVYTPHKILDAVTMNSDEHVTSEHAYPSQTKEK